MTYKELLDSTPFEDIEPYIINAYTHIYQKKSVQFYNSSVIF